MPQVLLVFRICSSLFLLCIALFLFKFLVQDYLRNFVCFSTRRSWFLHMEQNPWLEVSLFQFNLYSQYSGCAFYCTVLYVRSERKIANRSVATKRNKRKVNISNSISPLWYFGISIIVSSFHMRREEFVHSSSKVRWNPHEPIHPPYPNFFVPQTTGWTRKAVRENGQNNQTTPTDSNSMLLKMEP